MNPELKKIIDLSKVDAEIDSFGPKEEELKSELNKLIEKADDAKQSIENLTEEAKECRFKVTKHDTHLKEMSSKLADISKKSSTLKTEREIKALQIEEEIAKEQVAFANEEIERLEKAESDKKERIAKLEETLKEVAEQIKESEISLSDDLKTLDKAKEVVFAKKEKLVFDINPKVYSFYEKVKRWAHTSTVVPIVNQSCTGCNIVLSDSDYRKVLRSGDIITCPNCGRILYLDETELENA